jgi:cytochrome o ubiquinol oxidase subunit 1
VPLYVLGFMGMTRRLNHYDNPQWHPWLLVAEFGAILIAIGIAHQVAQLYVSIRDRNLPENRDTTGDPWNGRTLEWATTSPPPVYNFAVIPVVRELDEFAEMKLRKKDGHSEPVYRDIHMPSNTGAGLVVGAFSLVLGFAAIWHIWWLAIAGLVGVIGTVIARSFDKNTDYYIPASTVAMIEGRRTGFGGRTGSDVRVPVEID